MLTLVIILSVLLVAALAFLGILLLGGNGRQGNDPIVTPHDGMAAEADEPVAMEPAAPEGEVNAAPEICTDTEASYFRQNFDGYFFSVEDKAMVMYDDALDFVAQLSCELGNSHGCSVMVVTTPGPDSDIHLYANNYYHSAVEAYGLAAPMDRALVVVWDVGAEDFALWGMNVSGGSELPMAGQPEVQDQIRMMLAAGDFEPAFEMLLSEGLRLMDELLQTDQGPVAQWYGGLEDVYVSLEYGWFACTEDKAHVLNGEGGVLRNIAYELGKEHQINIAIVTTMDAGGDLLDYAMDYYDSIPETHGTVSHVPGLVLVLDASKNEIAMFYIEGQSDGSTNVVHTGLPAEVQEQMIVMMEGGDYRAVTEMVLIESVTMWSESR